MEDKPSLNEEGDLSRWIGMSRKLLVAIIGIVVVVSGIVCSGQGIGQAGIFVDYQKSGVQLSWTAPSQRISGERLLSSEIAGYNIFRSLIGEDNYQKINDHLIKDTHYFDQRIEWGKCYSYTLTTVDYQGLEGPRSPIVQAIAPLAPPSRFEAFGEKRSVRLSWDKGNNPSVRGYNIYRSEVSGRDYHLIASVLDTDHEYLDREVVVGKNYYYLIRTVDIFWQESGSSPEVAATPLIISQQELSALEKISGLRATIDKSAGALAVVLQWEPLALENLAGYNIYRRLPKEISAAGEKELSAYQRLNEGPVQKTSFRDQGVREQQTYFYLIAAVDKDGHEARFPREISITVADLYINSLTDDSLGRPLKGGELLTITMTATAGKQATATLEGVAQEIPLKETDQEGVYYGQYRIAEDISRSNIALIGTLQDEQGKKIHYVSDRPITIDNLAPRGISRASVELVNEAARLSWELAAEGNDDLAGVRIFRSLAKDGQRGGNCSATGPKELISQDLSPTICSFYDRTVRPQQGYYYFLVAYDRAGNEAWLKDCLFVVTPIDSNPPKIQSVEELSSPGTKRLGDLIRIQMLGEPGAQGRFSIGHRIQQPFQEVRPGKYLGEYKVQPGDDLENEPVVAELVDESNNRSVLTTEVRISIDTSAEASRPPQIKAVEHNAFQVAGLDPLVAGDTLRISAQGDPGCAAYADIGALVIQSGQEAGVELSWDGEEKVLFGRTGSALSSYRIYSQPDVSPMLVFLPGEALPPARRLVKELPAGATSFRLSDYQGGYLSVVARKSGGDEYTILTPRLNIPLTEIRPGFYEGTYRVQQGDRIRQGKVIAYLVSRQGERSAPFEASGLVTIDTSVAIAVVPKEKCLKADGKARTEVRIELSNARQIGLADREIAVELFTTDEYTGIAGVGRFDENKYGYVDNFYQLVTDFGGKVDIPYVSGLAAKTVIIRARDVKTGCVGVGYITSYIEGLINIHLIDPPARERLRGLQAEPTLVVWADQEWLTADGGHSRTMIHAKALDREGKPLEGHRMSFSITSGEGRIEEIQPITSRSGEAQARYIAGRHIGTVEITVVDTAAGLSRKVYIVLRSDAPAKMVIEAAPQSIWADGASSCDLTIRVGDMNDNPSRGIPLEVEIIQGEGKLIILDKELVTDFHGECRLKYLAGTKPETVTIRARARSTVPDSSMLEKVRVAEKGMY